MARPSPSNPQQTPRRKNGFSPPFAPAQISTWVALPALVIEFVLMVAPLLPIAAAIPCTLLFGLTAFFSAYYGAQASLTDPMDEHLAKHLQKQASRANGENNGNGSDDGGGFGGCLGGINNPAEPVKHCWICETQVAEHAMHCKFCNKCIGRFDHHCMWLNTCVGKANYPYFLLTMYYITAMLVVHGAIQAVLVLDIFLQFGGTRQRADDWFDTNTGGTLVVGIIIFFVIFDFVALSLIVQLLLFHMKLRKEGLTTYKFIVGETRRKREQRNLDEARQTKRTVAMGKANDDGSTLLAMRLRYGQYCTGTVLACCDPLPPDGDDGEEERKKKEAPKNDEELQLPSSSSSQQQQPSPDLPQQSASNGASSSPTTTDPSTSGAAPASSSTEDALPSQPDTGAAPDSGTANNNGTVANGDAANGYAMTIGEVPATNTEAIETTIGSGSFAENGQGVQFVSVTPKNN